MGSVRTAAIGKNKRATKRGCRDTYVTGSSDGIAELCISEGQREEVGVQRALEGGLGLALALRV